MAGLQVLEDQFGARGFHVLGFYSDDFGKQGGSDEQIREVTDKYSVTYPQFAVAPVSGEAPRPAFEWLLSHENPGPKEGDLAPNWNFHKWLISRKGELVAAYGIRDYPGEDPAAPQWQDSPIVKAINEQLGS